MKMMTAMYTMRRGGAYERFIMMIEAFLERGWEVHCLSLTPIRIENPLFHNHFWYWPFKKIDSLQAKFIVLLVFPIWAVWVGFRYRINLLVAFGAIYAFIQGLSKYILRKPMVTLIRGAPNYGLRNQKILPLFLYLNQTIENLGLRFSDLVITNNRGFKEEMLKKLKNAKDINVEILFNNILPMQASDPQKVIQTRAKYGIDESAKIIVTTGILNQWKNIEILIHCLKNIKMENLHLIIVGEGSKKADIRYEMILKELVKKLRIENRVHFTGWVDKGKLNMIFKASDLFVLPSLSEGMPNAMLEALGSGLPCIGSNIMGIRDILQYDELLFDPLNERLLAEKIKSFFTDQRFSNNMKRLCQERKQIFVFDWKEKVFEIITSHFIALLSNEGESLKKWQSEKK